MAPDAAASIASCHSTMSVRLSAAIQQESWTVERYRAKGSVLQPVAEGDESDGDLFLTASAKTLHELLWTFMEDVLPLHCRPTPDNSACCGLGLLLYSPVVNTMSSLLQTYVSELDATKEVAKDQTSAMLGAVADMSAIVEGLLPRVTRHYTEHFGKLPAPPGDREARLTSACWVQIGRCRSRSLRRGWLPHGTRLSRGTWRRSSAQP